MKIAFVGHAAVGKDTLSDHVSKKYTIPNVSSGDLVRNYIVRNNLGNVERENVRNVANKLRSEEGGDYLVRLALIAHPDQIILSGLRALDEVVAFKNMGGTVIAITASAQHRYELAKKRNRIDDLVSFEEWSETEEGDDHNEDKARGNVTAVINAAHYNIENTGTLEELYKKCDDILIEIQKGL